MRSEDYITTNLNLQANNFKDFTKLQTEIESHCKERNAINSRITRPPLKIRHDKLTMNCKVQNLK